MVLEDPFSCQVALTIPFGRLHVPMMVYWLGRHSRSGSSPRKARGGPQRRGRGKVALWPPFPGGCSREGRASGWGFPSLPLIRGDSALGPGSHSRMFL